MLGHTGIAFMGAGAGIAFLPVEDEGSWFMWFAYSGMFLIKTMIVPCFYAVSGYFAPSALDRKGPQVCNTVNPKSRSE